MSVFDYVQFETYTSTLSPQRRRQCLIIRGVHEGSLPFWMMIKDNRAHRSRFEVSRAFPPEAVRADEFTLVRKGNRSPEVRRCCALMQGCSAAQQKHGENKAVVAIVGQATGGITVIDSGETPDSIHFRGLPSSLLATHAAAQRSTKTRHACNAKGSSNASGCRCVLVLGA